MQFHTGLGDEDITLRISSPSHLQPLIKTYPNSIFVLLHSSYPYTREAGYLTSVYRNVYLDFGEVIVDLILVAGLLKLARCSHLYQAKGSGR